MPLRGAIFDLDGTLLDSMSVWEQVDIDFLHKRGLDVPPDYTKAVTPLGFRAAAVYTIERFNLPDSADELVDEWFAMAVDKYTYDVALKPGAKEYVEYLHAKGVRLGVATAARPQLFEPALKRNGIWDAFESFTLTSEVERGKAFPDIFTLAAQRINVPAQQCAVFEDIIEAIRGARAGGLRTIGLYDAYSASDTPAIRREADLYFESFQDILQAPETIENLFD